MTLLLADATTLACDLWPEKKGRLLQEGQVSVEQLPSTKKLPLDADGLSKWLYVDPQPHQSDALVCLQDGAQPSQNGLEVVVRIQGVVADMNLAARGTWDG